MKRLVDFGVQILLQPDVTRLGPEILTNEQSNLTGEQLSKPRGELRLRRAPKSGELAVRFHESFLHHVSRVRLALQSPADLYPGQQREVVRIVFEQPPQRALVARARFIEKRLRVESHGSTP